jgi:hypothetical protein
MSKDAEIRTTDNFANLMGNNGGKRQNWKNVFKETKENCQPHNSTPRENIFSKQRLFQT